MRVILNKDLNLTDTIHVDKGKVALSELITARGLPRGIHTKAPSGILCIIGPGIKKGYHLPSAHVYDVTPTVLYAMGLPTAKDFDGKCLLDAFTKTFIKNHPIEIIPSYGQRVPKDQLLETPEDERLKKELKALGYI